MFFSLWNLLGLCVALVKSQDAPDATLILQKLRYGKKYNTTCVVTGTAINSAMIFNSPLSNQNSNSVNLVSTFVPNRGSSFNCDIKSSNDHDNVCSYYWTTSAGWISQSSMQSDLSMVTDWRWEKFKTVYTQFYTFEQLAGASSNNFKIDISVRTKEAHIFLCDYYYPPSGNCYWILLGGWAGKNSAIRKCSTYQIPSKQYTYPKGDCARAKEYRNHTDETVLSHEGWTHFTIRKERNNIQVLFGVSQILLLSYTDEENAIDVKHIIGSSRAMSPGVWKVHDYEYAFSNVELTQNMGTIMNIDESPFCMSMFVAMCTTCRMFIQIFVNNPSELIEQKMIIPKLGRTWEEVKIIVNLPFVPIPVYITVTTICKGCEDKFWAIDEFQLCSTNELRLVNSNLEQNEINCQLIQYEDYQLVYTESQSNMETEPSCPNGTFGKSCTTCSTILGNEKYNCDKSVICEKQLNGENTCRCPRGYTGIACQQGCEAGFYGFNCKETCGFCEYNPCDPVTGACASGQCLYSFADFQCKTAPYPVLTNPPEIIDVKPTSCTVQLKNTSYEGLGIPSFYIIQYQNVGDKDWISLRRNFLSDTGPIDISNLNVLTSYFIRAVLVTDDGQSYTASYVPKINITTTCAFIDEKDIQIEALNTSANVTFESNSESCTVGDYYLIINNNQRVTFKDGIFQINNLQPFNNYTMKVYHPSATNVVEVHFKTAEGRPGVIEQLKTISSEFSISVSWKQPTITNGIIKYYIIKYQHTRYLGCSRDVIHNKTSESVIQEKRTSTELTGLVPFSQYKIRVVAYTVIEGAWQGTITNTKATETPLEEESPTIENIETDATKANVFIKQPTCEFVKGPIIIYLALRCVNEWCDQAFSYNNYSNVDYTLPLVISNILPYSNYTMDLLISRAGGNTFLAKKMTAQFNTKATRPNIIKNVVAYSRNRTTIELRFPPPYPPTGQLKDYHVAYCYGQKNYWGSSNPICDAIFVPITNCRRWPKLHCITVTKLLANKLYELSISASNFDTNYNTPSKIEVTSKSDAPGPPENLATNWDEYYNLTLTWDHPSITNGPIKFFNIKVFTDVGLCCSRKYQINEEDYINTYNYVIPIPKQCYSSELNIYVLAMNNKEGPAATLHVYSPPKTAFFTTTPIIEEVTNTTISISVPLISDLEKNSSMYTIVSSKTEKMETADINEEIWIQAKVPKEGNSWMCVEYDFTQFKSAEHMLVIGNGSKQLSPTFNKELYNKPLVPSTDYIVSLLLVNRFQDKQRFRAYQVETATVGMKQEELSQSTNYGLFGLLVLLLIPALMWIIFKKYKNNKKIPWSSILNNNSTASNTNPDIIPLTNGSEKMQISSNLRTKHKMPENVQVSNASSSKQGNEYSKPIKITEFENYVRESIQSGELERQHQLFPRGQTKPWDYGLLPQNKSKNRYNNLIAYDHSRVKLEVINNDTFSDYINANYIDGYNTKKAYIATQGPKIATVDDFWRMIWQENVGYIVMLANVIEGGKKKTEQYWPNINENLTFDKIRVDYLSSQVFADYEYRIFVVTCGDEERKVEQLHFTSWPDHGVPLYSQSLVPFLRKLLTVPQGTSPIVVHCSAGVGRTGTIILIDLCLRMAAREGVVDILKHQHNLREQRANLVDNVEQYKLAHLVLLECLIAPQTTIVCDENMENVVQQIISSKRIDEQIEYLNKTAWQDLSMRPAGDSPSIEEWSTKNRFPDVVPTGYGRVYLSRYPVTDEHSDYINAVEVDGFQCPEMFIATQQPLPNTVSDFWRMIDEKEVTTIVSLNEINKDDESSCLFWPTDKINTKHPVDYLTLKFLSKTKDEYYDKITIEISNNKKKKVAKRIMYLLLFKKWFSHELVPSDADSLIKLWEETERISRGSNPVVVCCYNGATACGLFIAVSFVIEKMKLEQQCDVCLAVRTVRHNRKQFVTDKEQFVYMYQAALSYLSGFDLYSNFSLPVKK